MFRIASLASSLLLILAIAGCGGAPRFDVSSEESTKASRDRMEAALTPLEKEALKKDIGTVVMQDGLQRAVQDASSREKSPSDRSAVFKTLQGLTAWEIHEKAETIRRSAPSKPSRSEPAAYTALWRIGGPGRPNRWRADPPFFGFRRSRPPSSPVDGASKGR